MGVLRILGFWIQGFVRVVEKGFMGFQKGSVWKYKRFSRFLLKDGSACN